MQYIIGIDPGKNTGIAVFDREAGEIVDVQTLSFWGAIAYLDAGYPPSVVWQVRVEVPRNKAVWHKQARNRGAIERTSVNVGAVIREAELLVEGLERMGYTVLQQHPRGKISSEVVAKITGYSGRTNQHTRDAIMLAYK